MEIIRSVQQQPETIEEFYLNLAQEEIVSEYYRICGRMMYDLIHHLRTNVPGPSLVAVTAHHDTVLYDNERCKRVEVGAWNWVYRISCQPHPEDTSWPRARLVGYTTSMEEAASMIVEAFKYVYGTSL